MSQHIFNPIDYYFAQCFMHRNPTTLSEQVFNKIANKLTEDGQFEGTRLAL